MQTYRFNGGLTNEIQSGFPVYQLDRFLKMLVQDLNEFVAISEEFPNDVSKSIKSGDLMHDRRVVRTVTPGTLIDERFMDPFESNFLLALHPQESDATFKIMKEEIVPVELLKDSIQPSRTSQAIGLAWLDLSTGDFFTQTTTFGTLGSAVARIGAREIVLSDELDKSSKSNILGVLEQQRDLVTYHSYQTAGVSMSSWTPMLDGEVPLETGNMFTDQEIAAGSLLLAYVKARTQSLGIKLQPPVRRQERETMSIDKSSMRALEVLGTSKEGLGGGKGSLLYTIRRTVTKSGTRLLREWIASPSMSLEVINARLDLVSCLLHGRDFKEKITNLLRRTFDSRRLVQKFSMGRGDADDLISLLRTIEATNGIASTLKSYVSPFDTCINSMENGEKSRRSLQALSRRLSLEKPSELANLIGKSIDEDSLSENHRSEENQHADMVTMAQGVLQHEGSIEDQAALSQISRAKTKPRPSFEQEAEDVDSWVLRRSASPVLDKLHGALDDLCIQKKNLSSCLRESLDAPSLTLRWTPGLGYICHVKGAKDVKASLRISTAATDVRTTKSTRSFHQVEWSRLGSKIDQAKLRIRAEEQNVFQMLRQQVVLNLVTLRRNAAVLDELDIGCSFANLAEEQDLVRPILNLGFDHKIIGGRHPTVKLGLEQQGRAFVSNDCLIGEQERIWLITGPNMAGKSTFLRQNALISILAQIGSFVPAERAEIGLVDQIFTRVGSADNLFRDQSTFMVEMMETAVILNQATHQSFVIMDEIGRGTTPEDGIAVAFACLHHLYFKNRCRMLFATHFHTLADMTADFKNIACYHTDVAEGPGNSFSFIHRLQKGVNRSSHALKVASLAGIPESAIETARAVLDSLALSPAPAKRTTLEVAAT